MSDDMEVGLDYNEAPLSEEQISQVEAASDLLRDALADLGAAHAEHKAIYNVYRKSLQDLEARETAATIAQEKHDVTMASLAKAMDLPPGQWTYDKATGTLKKD